MMYRDDHEAALLRIESLERENEALTRKVSLLQRVHRPSPAVTPPAPHIESPPPAATVAPTRYRDADHEPDFQGLEFLTCLAIVIVLVTLMFAIP